MHACIRVCTCAYLYYVLLCTTLVFLTSPWPPGPPQGAPGQERVHCSRVSGEDGRALQDGGGGGGAAVHRCQRDTVPRLKPHRVNEILAEVCSGPRKVKWVEEGIKLMEIDMVYYG